MAITQEFDLNLIPSSAPVVVHVDQYDHGTGRLVASLYNGETPYSPSSASVYVQGTKPDGKFFVSSTGVTLSDNVVTADLTEVMTQVSGRTRIQFVVTEQSGRTGTFVFFLEVQASALPNDSELSQSDFSMVEEAIEMIQQSVSDAAESAQESAGSAQASSDSAEDSEAWAKGTRDGEPVESTDETYHNNAKYWAEQAAASASHDGHTIEDENGTQMTARTYLQFTNADVVDDPTNNRTVVTPRGGTGGSTIIVSTTETSLYNKNVTISDGVNTVTEQFSALGVATFAGVTMTGSLSITSTDGTETAHATLDVPYYGSYSKAITFFSATIHVAGDNAIFVGKTVKAVKNGVVIASATFTSATSGAEADIVVGESGTYTVECQVEWRNVQSASINVSSETTYNASLSCIATTCFIVTSDTAFANADIVVTLDGEPSATETIQFVNSEATYVAVKAGTYTFTVTYQGVDYAVTQVIGDSAPITIILQRWSATLNITTTSSTLYGQSITITKGGATVGTTAFSAVGAASYTVHETGTYTLDCEGYTATQAVSAQTTYNVTINAGLDLQSWLTEGGVSGTYADFSALEADEAAVRQLMLVHDAVDYLATASAGDSLMQSVINSNVCAKWINNSDYALDTLGANSDIASEMATADKYFYGEWGITDSTTTPPTWGALGCVPVMTSNTAPYGVASAYQVFDGNASTSASGTDFSYQSVNPICVKKFECSVNGGTLQGSNDGSTYTNISDPSSNTTYYMYHRVHFASSQTVHTLQFYGRELTPLIPTMTSNTTPKGTVKGVYSNSANAYKAFDGDNTTYASDERTSGGDHVGQIYYEFDEPVICGGFGVLPYYIQSNGNQYLRDYIIKASNDGETWVDVDSGRIVYAATTLQKKGFAGNTAYKYWSIYGENGYQSSASGVMTNGGMIIYTLQFYGSDYSEKEFASGSTAKWIYDHGVELMELSVHDASELMSDYIKVKTGSTQTVYGEVNTANQIDFGTTAKYSVMRFVAGSVIDVDAQYQIASRVDVVNAGREAYVMANIGLPDQTALDVSSITGNHYFRMFCGNVNREHHVKEIWLE